MTFYASLLYCFKIRVSVVFVHFESPKKQLTKTKNTLMTGFVNDTLKFGLDETKMRNIQLYQNVLVCTDHYQGRLAPNVL